MTYVVLFLSFLTLAVSCATTQTPRQPASLGRIAATQRIPESISTSTLIAVHPTEAAYKDVADLEDVRRKMNQLLEKVAENNWTSVAMLDGMYDDFQNLAKLTSNEVSWPNLGFLFDRSLITWAVPSQTGNLVIYESGRPTRWVTFRPHVSRFIIIGSDFTSCVERAIDDLVSDIFPSKDVPGKTIEIHIPMELMQTTVDSMGTDQPFRTTMSELAKGKIPIRFQWREPRSLHEYIIDNFFLPWYPIILSQTEDAAFEPAAGPYLFSVPAHGYANLNRDKKTGAISRAIEQPPLTDVNPRLSLDIQVDGKTIFSFNKSGSQKVMIYFWSSLDNPRFQAAIAQPSLDGH